MRIPFTSLRSIGLKTLPVALLATAVVLGASAWALQSSAARDLEEAYAIGQRDAPSDDSPPPQLEDYRAILDTISRSVEIRRNVDDLLTQVEDTVALFEDQRAQAEDITASASAELEEIARSLDSSIAAASTSDEKLSTLRARLVRSAQLVAAIARELEELDESLGPSAGSGP